jgi:DNA primase catalytic core, N-terminal domain
MINYQQILENLDYKLKDCGNFWQAAAVYRDGDNPTALQIYKDTGVWKDFVEDTIFLPFSALVEKTTGSKDQGLIQSIINGSKNSEPRTPKKKLLTEEKSFDKECLKRLLPHYDFYTKQPKSISLETIRDYRCGLATSGAMYQRLVFPIFRQDGKIHGFSGRKVLEDNDKPKWLHKGKSSNFFYPFYTTKLTSFAIKNTKRVFLVESIGDSLSLYDKEVEENLVTFGLSLSPKFISRLSSLPVEKIIVAFNNDFGSEKNRGLIGAVKAILKMSEVIDIQRLYLCLPHKNDFGVMNKEDVDFYLKGFENISHKDSCKKVIDEAKFIEKQFKTPNQSFSSALRKFIKKYNFNYAD